MIEIDLNEKNLSCFVDNLRLEDKKELWYFFGKDYKKEFIKLALNTKNTYFLADKNNNPSAIGGVESRSVNSKKIGQVWLLCAKSAIKNKIFLYKYVRSKIELFKKDYDILFNSIYKSNFEALNWLRRCGFEVLNLANKDFKVFYFNKGEKNIDLRYIAGE